MPDSTRDQLLRRLRDGQWLSGEQLAQELGLTRAAVAKQVAVLKQQGYLIEAAPRRGYRLQSLPDSLLPAEIRAGLVTARFGQGLISYLESTASTNQDARELAEQGAAEGSLVVAEQQTAGRGRRGRSWYSAPGVGVYLSLILRPALAASEVARLTITAAVAACEALRELSGLDVRIKWPNDLLVGQRKLGGILTEVSMDQESVSYAVVGLGLNVATGDFPPELAAIATSLRLASGRELRRAAVVRGVLERFERRYDELLNEGFAGILAEFKALSNVIGREVEVTIAGEGLRGLARDIDADGFLLLELGGGGVKRVLAGDIRPLD
ncbi:MAG: Bifunctional ligase/repressor BirA [Deltaproteobacteria bacterium ADurb.Bin510]|nr:MAG: Bifunctional ligase/repressor BirA [Deltaproteobacteria bacterium ADurb.Bin510]